MKIISTNEIDQDRVTDFFKEHWGSTMMVISSGVFQCDQLEGYGAARDDGAIIGLVTYSIDKDSCEIISLDSVIENHGIGTQLVLKVEQTAKEQGCHKMKLITTNDNIHALGFYQKRGYRIVDIYSDAVEKARKLKPEIPPIADNGIPICDELLLEKSL